MWRELCITAEEEGACYETTKLETWRKSSLYRGTGVVNLHLLVTLAATSFLGGGGF